MLLRIININKYTEPLYNGNIAQTFWKTASDNVFRGYNYEYDKLNRLLNAEFYKRGTQPYSGAYKESLAYDVNGNIKSLYRTTGDGYGNSIEMDDLSYGYKDGQGNSNLLFNVSDAVSNGNTDGFVDGNTNPSVNDYVYDSNGNMISDKNKGITSITYNHLNLPVIIKYTNSKLITYTYNAAGQKIKKTVQDETTIKNVDYLDGFQYAGEVLNFFPTPEGYVKATPTALTQPGSPPAGYAYSYVFNYTDHLGNIRLSYTKDPQTGTLDILEENHYYPFGLRHGVYNNGGKKDFTINLGGGVEPGQPPILENVARLEYQYRYNGFEYQDELGLGWYDYGARNYDATIGRWMNVDPLAEVSRRYSPYTYALDNPVYFIDPDGMMATPPGDFVNEQGVKVGSDGIEDGKMYVIKTTQTSFDSGVASAGITQQQATDTENFIKENSGNAEAFQNNSIAYDNSVEIQGSETTRQGMMDVVNNDNGIEPFNLSEYGANISITGIVGKTQTGTSYKVGDKTVGVEIPIETNTQGTIHSHNSYEKIVDNGNGTSTRYNMKQAPSQTDLTNAGNRTDYVAGMRDQTMYIYNQNGVIATVPLVNFVTPNQ